MAGCGTTGTQETFELHSCDHIVNAVVAIFWNHRWIEYVISSGQNDGTHLQVYRLILLLVINSVCLTDLGTDATLFALTQLAAVLGINAVGRGDTLGEILINGWSIAKADIEIIRDRDRTLFRAGATTGTEVFVHIAGLLPHPYIKGTDLAADFFDLAISEEIDFGMPTGIQQLRRQNSDGAVIGRKGLVQLGHLATDARKLLHQVDLDTHFS